MTTREKLQALLDGKKLRKDTWARHTFIHLGDNGALYREDGRYASEYWISEANMIYAEPHGFSWAREQVKKGRAVRRSEWPKDYIWCEPNGLEALTDGGDSFSLSLEDLDANDWELA